MYARIIYRTRDPAVQRDPAVYRGPATYTVISRDVRSQ